MNTEMKQLIEDAAKLLSLGVESFASDGMAWVFPLGTLDYEEVPISKFNPLDPERGDLLKVAEAAKLTIDFEFSVVVLPKAEELFDVDETEFTKGDYQSLAFAVLRAASAVLKSRGE